MSYALPEAIAILKFMETDQDFIAIRSVIERQLAAFQQDDARGAFALASPTIQEQFQTPESFLRMVSISYPAVYRPRSVFFEKITTIQGNITQSVLLLSPHGIPLRALYFMEKQPDDTWRINGCFLVSVEAEII
jgi:Domain of unknown function (DUF4864)